MPCEKFFDFFSKKRQPFGILCVMLMYLIVYDETDIYISCA